jgi:hypothetical protein
VDGYCYMRSYGCCYKGKGSGGTTCCRAVGIGGRGGLLVGNAFNVGGYSVFST